MIRRLGITAISLLFIGVVAFYSFQQLLNHYGDSLLQNSEPSVLEVPRGSSIKSIARDLKAQGLINDARWFEWYSRLQADTTRIQSGFYELPPGTRVSALLDMMVSGKVQQLSITLVEGTTVADALALILSQPGLVHNGEPLNPSSVATAIGAEGNPEGLLFPDTYFFTAGTPALELVKRAHERLQSVLAEEWEQRAPELPYKTAYEALIMASIVERETGVASERGEIAGVFVRRLRKGMRLQTDPTVIYGLGERYKGNITRKHLTEETPYNTYRISGLPPTPIALAGREAIHAALHPTPGNTLYFVARGDGSHQFSATLEAHNLAVRQYQLKRRKDYRSSPASEGESSD
ncbi:endolytic transglycosylase MltG [Aestuariirhabdus litorea]|uniref:Endolytic murein transglycosylase n=1 Tax=Aestuariirhabdus litorea TaxID=2528527 RepID=A0A3P3VQW6_9GAMM|nr:endolytic transglycosylase MltG [Aestuariirhabdus litorea]RRJ84707.1 endolytic transglycosylase MltG [Aestuariirhabdus litorea]RWW97932.1 endolytic transglycosylase MltG [Endozoicomonadaceae bacterium GTF-13]